MSKEKEEQKSRLTLVIPTIRKDSETQTVGCLASKSLDKNKPVEMDEQMSLRKRRTLSKNRSQATRQREKTPEPGRTPIPHEDTTTSDDEDNRPRNSREVEASASYEEMKRLVKEQANSKDPVYDLDIDEVREARAFAAHERRRRSISPFALPDKEELANLKRKGSFIDPGNKLLTTTAYALTPKDEDNSRRNSLTTDLIKERKHSLSTPSTASLEEKEFPYTLPMTPKKLEQIVYPDEVIDESRSLKTPVKKESIFYFEEKRDKQSKVPNSPKTPETPISGEAITRIIQIERTPSKILTPENKPNVEVRRISSQKLTPENKPHVELNARIVRTPSKKTTSESKPKVVKQEPNTEQVQVKVPPVKPARIKSTLRYGGKTSESELSEDQVNHQITNYSDSKRKVIPRRFLKNKSPRPIRSQSAHRVEDLKIIDKMETGVSQTSCEILELMQKARARSLSIPKDDPRLPSGYKNVGKNLYTPSTTPRNTRGISCPKTIQIISDKEILAGLLTGKSGVENEVKNSKCHDKSSRQSSGYIDASQSEYTSSCYSSSPSDNELKFDLSERTAELTHKLNLLSQEVSYYENAKNILLSHETISKDDHLLTHRKRSITTNKNAPNKTNKDKSFPLYTIDNKTNKTRWKIFSNWQDFKTEQKFEYDKLKLLRNRCVCDLLLLIIMCGLGGMMFKSLEGSFENAYKCGSSSVKRDFIESLWRGSHYLREEDWKSMARNKLHEFENQLHTAFEAGVTTYSGQRSWSFMNSFVYCLTLITTIGYGHIAPKTTSGRVATIIYAIVGIPLFLIVLADFGKLFTRVIKFFWAYIRRFYYTRSCRKVRRTVPVQEVIKGLNIMYDAVRRPSQIFNENDIDSASDNPPQIERRASDVPPPLPPKPVTVLETDPRTEPTTPAPSAFEIDDEFNLPISVAICVLLIYIIIGAFGYSMRETWSFFESFYFVFISMSTIGLGDLVPDHPMFMMGSILYLVFGLALTSMCINVVQVKLSDTFRQASAKLGATIGLKVCEEDGSLVTMTPAQTEDIPEVHKTKKEVDSKKEKN